MQKNLTRYYVVLMGLLLLAFIFIVFSHYVSNSNVSSIILIVMLTLILWASRIIPESITSFIFFTLCMVGAVAPTNIVFSGFTSSATWLVVAGTVLGTAIQHTGLADRIANRIITIVRGTYTRTIFVITCAGMLLIFFIPSATARVVLMIPILNSVANHLGYSPESRGRTGILLAGILGTFLPATAVLPANIPNNVLAGLMETTLEITPSYSTYLLLHFPVLGLLKILLLVPLLIYFYRDNPLAASDAEKKLQKISPSEIRFSFIIMIASILWFTDGWHGISPAWIGMVAAITCVLPGFGILEYQSINKLNYEPMFYVAAVVSLGTLIDHSGFVKSMSELLLSSIQIDSNQTWSFLWLSFLSTITGIFVTLPGVPAIMTPLTTELSAITGFSVSAVAMTQVIGFSTVFFPYQAPPLIVAIQLGNLSAKNMLRICLITAFLSILILWPIDYVWWLLLGWLK